MALVIFRLFFLFSSLTALPSSASAAEHLPEFAKSDNLNSVSYLRDFYEGKLSEQNNAEVLQRIDEDIACLNKVIESVSKKRIFSTDKCYKRRFHHFLISGLLGTATVAILPVGGIISMNRILEQLEKELKETGTISFHPTPGRPTFYEKLKQEIAEATHPKHKEMLMQKLKKTFKSDPPSELELNYGNKLNALTDDAGAAVTLLVAGGAFATLMYMYLHRIIPHEQYRLTKDSARLAELELLRLKEELLTFKEVLLRDSIESDLNPLPEQ